MRLAQLCAQLSNVTIDRTRVGFFLVSPHHIEQLTPSEWSPGVHRENHEQVKLTTSEIKRLVSDLYLVGLGVDYQRADR